jgi:hypothetical protein
MDKIQEIKEQHALEGGGWELEKCSCGKHFIWREELQHGYGVIGTERQTAICPHCGERHRLPKAVHIDWNFEK